MYHAPLLFASVQIINSMRLQTLRYWVSAQTLRKLTSHGVRMGQRSLPCYACFFKEPFYQPCTLKLPCQHPLTGIHQSDLALLVPWQPQEESTLTTCRDNNAPLLVPQVPLLSLKQAPHVKHSRQPRIFILLLYLNFLPQYQIETATWNKTVSRTRVHNSLT